jgi:hypothetical protein
LPADCDAVDFNVFMSFYRQELQKL